MTPSRRSVLTESPLKWVPKLEPEPVTALPPIYWMAGKEPGPMLDLDWVKFTVKPDAEGEDERNAIQASK